MDEKQKQRHSIYIRQVTSQLLLCTLTSLINGQTLINGQDGKSILPAVLVGWMEFSIYYYLHEYHRVGWNLFLQKNERRCPFTREVRIVLLSYFLWLVWGRNQVYCACCSSQMARAGVAPSLTGQANYTNKQECCSTVQHSYLLVKLACPARDGATRALSL